MKTKKTYFHIALIAIAMLHISCGAVKRIRTEQVKDISGRWNDTDARLVAEEMTADIIQRPWHSNFLAKYERKPVVILGEVLNKSHEHIDSEPFIKDLEKDLINSQVVRIITNGTFREKIRSERKDQQQQQDRQTDNETGKDLQKKLGRELGADFMLFGYINTIVDSSDKGKERIIFYQVTLELTDLDTNEIVWIGSKKIKKYVKK
jgi:uncharacterized protein (TIGR02722 family)